MPLRASVTADAQNTNPGDPAPILIDGADTPCTANGLQNYTPRPGDRLLVDKVGGTLEVIQFLTTGSVPFVATYRQDTDPALTGTVPDGAIWFDTSQTNAVSTREGGAWVPMTFGKDAIDVPSVQSVVVNQGFVLAGGTAELSNGATNPTAGPTISSYYPSYHTTFYGSGGDVSAFFAGLDNDPADSTKWVSAAIFFGTQIRVVNKSDGQIGVYPDPSNGKSWVSNYYSWGGIAADGTYYWLLGSDNDRSTDTYIYAIDSSFNKAAELRLGGSGAFNGYHPRMVSDTVNHRMGMIWIPSSGNLMLRWYHVSSGAIVQVGSDITLKTGVGQQNIGGAHFGDAGSGLGASTLWVTLESATGSNPQVMCWSSVSTTAATRQSTYDFNKAKNGISLYPQAVHALSYDSASGHFTSLDLDGVAWTYSTVAASGSQSVSARYTYYDGDTGNYAGAVGSGTVIINGVDVSGTASTAHETGYSPTTTVTFPRRAWPIITVGAAPDVNNTDATLVDRANRQGVYCAIGGGTMWRLTYTSVGQTVVSGWEAFPTSGTPDSHDFSTAQVSLGELKSAATRQDGLPKTYIDGSGQARLDGLLPPGVIVQWGGLSTNIPAGWLYCNGQAVSRTTYADLFAVIGTSFGAGDGSTTFNVPNFSGRIPYGANGTHNLGSTAGSETHTLTTAEMPSHSHGASGLTLGFQWSATTTSGGTANRVTDINNQTGGGGTSATASLGGSTASAGSGGAHSILNPILAVQFLIKW